jgi:hypothetical protein
MKISESAKILKDAIEQFSPTHIVSMVSGGKAGEMKHEWFLGGMNDGLFIINAPPRPSGTDAPPQMHDEGPTVILNATDLSDKKAQAICDAHNAVVAILQLDNASLRERVERMEKENERLRETLCKIAKAETVVFDDDLRTDVVVSAGEDEMANWAREVLDLFPAGDDFSDAVALIEKAYPDHNWHIAKGRLSADEPLYGALIMEGGAEIAGGESDISAAAAMKSAILSARATLQNGGPRT